eukprot:Awhi_evm1s12212
MIDTETLIRDITEIYEAVLSNEDGKVADYIPQLKKVDPSLFAISACTVNGDVINIGDFNHRFCLQSCSKPLTYCIALEELGREKLHQHVGKEPSGIHHLPIHDY